jgi:CO/xanthine dehydrogenase Mo-binding subunit
MTIDTGRRAFLAGGGALTLSFAMPGAAFAAPGELPKSLDKSPWLDAWIRIEANERITVFTGKAELGQGIKTALLQVVADELRLAPGRLQLVTADTARTPDEGITAGSNSMKDSGTALRHAAGQVRLRLGELAATRLGAPAGNLALKDGAFSAGGRARNCICAPRRRPHHPRQARARQSASRCRASISRPRSRAARPTCKTCACRRWCMRGSCGRRHRPRG